MKTVLHKAATRGHANYGWLDTWHSFSFANYHDPSRMHFGALRVLNDDTVAPGAGFGQHPHENMEIISIPLEGELEHTDNLGNTALIRPGDVQVMSAGTGVVHAEKNKHIDQPVKFLQIWIFPKQQNLSPRYDQQSFRADEKKDHLLTIVSPVGSPDGGVKINQDAWFYWGQLSEGSTQHYALQKQTNGVYAFLLSGDITVNDIVMNERDGLGIWEAGHLAITANTGAELLLMEVPM